MNAVHTSSENPRRGAPRREDRLTRHRVVTEATELIAADGLDSFSLRRLAQALEVAPNALYNHVHSRDELLDAVTEQIVADLHLPDQKSTWPDWLHATAAGLRSQLLTHRGLTDLVLARAGSTAPGASMLTEFLDRLEAAGLDRAVAHVAWHTMLTLVVGSLAQDHLRPARGAPTFNAELEVLVAGLETMAQHPPSRQAATLLDTHELAQRPTTQTAALSG